MHLLLLGIQNTMMLRTVRWHKLHVAGFTFVRYTMGILNLIQYLKLSWCKTIPYKNGKLGVWVNKNYLAMTRLDKLFFSSIININADNSIQEIEKLTKCKWRKRHYIALMTICDLDNSGNHKKTDQKS